METLVIVSGLGSVLMMTRMWDVLQEAPLFQSDFGEGTYIFLNDVYSSLNILFLIAFIQPSLLLLAGALRKPNSMVLKVKMPEVKKIFKVP